MPKATLMARRKCSMRRRRKGLPERGYDCLEWKEVICAGRSHDALYIADDLVGKAEPSMPSFVPGDLLRRRKVRLATATKHEMSALTRCVPEHVGVEHRPLGMRNRRATGPICVGNSDRAPVSQLTGLLCSAELQFRFRYYRTPFTVTRRDGCRRDERSILVGCLACGMCGIDTN
jgi:hypothetical protein